MASTSGLKRQRKERNGDLPLLGAHMSIAGGIPLAIQRATQADCNVLQVFVKNNTRWEGRPLLDEEVEVFRAAWAASDVRQVVAHNSYLINLASPDNALRLRSIQALVDELQRCERLGLSYLVIHPGSHMGEGEKRGIRRIARALDQVHHESGVLGVRIALETTAGQGTSVGYRFEHLRDIIGACRYSASVFVCVDTCHIFAAGYDIRAEEGYAGTMKAFDQVVGIGRVKVFHFNDSKKELGSRVDRHDHIGRGMIGESGFASILNDRRFRLVPKILETPKGKTPWHDRRNLRVLRSLID